MFEHPGEQTFPVSCIIVKRGGMVVFCAGTTGYNLTMDARFVWMRQKRIQGSHFANLLQASQANQLVIERRIDPCMSEVFEWADIPKAHTKMWKNQHKPGQHGGAGLGQAARPAHPRRRPGRLMVLDNLLGLAAEAEARPPMAYEVAAPRGGARAGRRRKGKVEPARLEREQFAAHGFAWIATYVAGAAPDAALGRAAGCAEVRRARSC